MPDNPGGAIVVIAVLLCCSIVAVLFRVLNKPARARRLVEKLRSTDPEVRAEATETLVRSGKSDDRATLQALIKALSEPSWDMWSSGALVLCRIGTLCSIKPVADAVLDKTQPFAKRARIAEILSRSDENILKTVLPFGENVRPFFVAYALLHQMRERFPESWEGELYYKAHVAVGLSREAYLGWDEVARLEDQMAQAGDLVIPVLVDCLNEPDYLIRLFASETLVRIGAPAFAPLAGAKFNPVPAEDSRILTLAQIAKPRYAVVRSEDRARLEDVPQGPTASDELAALRLALPHLDNVSHPDAEVRHEAARNLILLGSELALEPLARALRLAGTVPLAEDYLNCGNQHLESCAETWAREHGYIVVRKPGPGRPRWGQGMPRSARAR